MIYTRIIVNNTGDEVIDLLNAMQVIKNVEFSFYDLIYLNKNGASITEDTLKIRVYQKTELDANVLVLRKIAPFVNGVKEDQFLLNKKFDTEEEAVKFVKDNYDDSYEFSFKLEKIGTEYQKEGLKIWLENVKDIGISIEFGCEQQETIEDIINLFNIKERLNISLPEYIYLKKVKKN